MSRGRIVAALVLALAFVGRPAAAEVPVLLRDINPLVKRGGVSAPGAVAGNRLYTYVSTPDTGSELGIINVGNGSLTVVDIEPGPDSSLRFGTNFHPLADGRLLFTAHTTEHGQELWVSDGTAQGTTLVADIWPGPDGSFPINMVDIDVDTVLFNADDGMNGQELWISNGTPNGTFMLVDINPGQPSSYPDSITLIPGGFLMSACGPTAGCEPYFLKPFVTSGFLDVISPGQSAPNEFAVLANPATAVFAGSIDSFIANDVELWVTDELTVGGTSVLKDIVPGDVGSHPRNLRLVNGVVLFDAETPETGRELWRTDGTPGGTVPIADIFPGPHDGLDQSRRPLPLGATQLVFPAIFQDAGTELAVMDGTTVTRLTDAIPGPGSGWIASQLITTAATAYASIVDTTHGLELWQTDGTPAHTGLVADLMPGPASSQPVFVAADDDTVYFIANAPGSVGLYRQTSGGEPSLVRDFSGAGTDDAGIGIATRLGGRLLFRAFDPEAGAELWSTDGTPDGTERVLDLVPGFESGSPGNAVTLGNLVFFNGTDGIHGRELFVSDGTAAGTHMVIDAVPGDGDLSPSPQTVLGNQVLLNASTPGEGREPWVSDGTPEGTHLLKDVVPGEGNSNIRAIVTSGSRAFFVSQNLWITDGTADGTIPVDEDLFPTGDIVPFGQGSVLFEAIVGFNFADRELWISDGTPGGTHLVKDVVPGIDDGGRAQFIVAAGSHAFFMAFTNEGVGLWVTDGTDTGTTLVKAPITPSENETFTFQMVAIGERVVFPVVTNAGLSVWVSDGTPAGTQQLTAICPSASCPFTSLFTYENEAFFNFDDGTHGTELWRTVGTPAGTSMVADVAPGPASFSFQRNTATAVNGKIFFSACETTHGCEPWVLDHDQCPADTSKLAPGACGCGTADADTDASGVADCLIASELRARIDALRALIESVTKPKSKDERKAFKQKMDAVNTAFAAMVAYRDAHTDTFPDLKKPLKKVKKAIKRLRQRRGAPRPRTKALTAVENLRATITGP